MKKDFLRLTTSQFAELNSVNKRTLHYYDSIGLFSPNYKGENGYRYYDLSQSIDFQYILMLKSLNMSIDEIKQYIELPTYDRFTEFAKLKELEIDKRIKELKNLKKSLKSKTEQINLCKSPDIFKIEVKKCEQENLLVLPYDFNDKNIFDMFYDIKNSWKLEQIQTGVGSMISCENILKNNFSEYYAIYTTAPAGYKTKNCFIKPSANYICCHHKGDWDTLPEAYNKIISYAKENSLKLCGYSYEIGLNEFAISSRDDYITKIMVMIQNNSP